MACSFDKRRELPETNIYQSVCTLEGSEYWLFVTLVFFPLVPSGI